MWFPLLTDCSSTGDRSEDRLRTPIQRAAPQEEVQRPGEPGVHPDPDPDPEPREPQGRRQERLQLAELHLYQRA